MGKPIRSAGDLRVFLGEVMSDVRDGKVKAQEAQAMAKLAAQVNQSFYAEAMMAHRLGAAAPLSGDLALGYTPLIEHDPQPALPVEPITDDELREVRKMLERGDSLAECAGYLGCAADQLTARLEAA